MASLAFWFSSATSSPYRRINVKITDGKAGLGKIRAALAPPRISLCASLLRLSMQVQPYPTFTMSCAAADAKLKPEGRHNENGVDDSKKSLRQIAHDHGKSVISLLLDIQREKCSQEKSIPFLKKLECLGLPREYHGPYGSYQQYLPRRLIDAFECRDYVALSYTWGPSKHEDADHGDYYVQRQAGEHEKSPMQPEVRNCVLRRITQYMRAAGVGLLWIDQHGMFQKMPPECEDAADCLHSLCDHKREGMQVMDLVYQLSDHPVGLLGRPISSERELKLLGDLLLGDLVQEIDGNFMFLKHLTADEAWDMLSMLSEITSDDWWQRGWIFQENYRGGVNMQLLISHSTDLEDMKRSFLYPNGRPVFGAVQGELCFRSILFSEKSTKFCRALQDSGPLEIEARLPSGKTGQEVIDGILGAAGKYTILLDPSAPMTPTLVRDVERRTITKPWDRLAITANCCRYSVRLNSERLLPKHSLSLSVLALCLLNGEVVHNGRLLDPQTVSNMTVTKYLDKYIFRGVKEPILGGSLTFNKGCRLFHVSLDETGVQTQGHLWELGDILDTTEFPACSTWQAIGTDAGSWLDRQRRLTYIARLIEPDYPELSHELFDIVEWLVGDLDTDIVSAGFSKRYMMMMAAEIADAFAEGRLLRLGRLVSEGGDVEKNPYMSVFVWDWDDEGSGSDSPDNQTAYAFTASKRESGGSRLRGNNDLDRHVSFEVSVEGVVGIPELRISRWLPGLCFFSGQERRRVVFPWPDDLRAVKP